MEQQSPNISQYEITNSKDEYYLFNSEFFNPADQPLLQFLKCYKIPLKTDAHTYNLNCRYLKSPINTIKNPVMMLHGHASSCTWAEWIRLGLTLFSKGHNVLMMDLPSYGKSFIDGKTRSNPKIYISDCHNMIKGVLGVFGIQKIHAVGHCGGAANFLRTMIKYPKLFAKSHIFHNAVISDIPLDFEKVIEANKMRVWVSWAADPDHSKSCVAYKWYDQRRKNKNERIVMRDLKGDELPLVLLWSSKMGRNTSSVEAFEPCQKYEEFAVSFLRGDVDVKYGNKKGETLEESQYYETLVAVSEQKFCESNPDPKQLQAMKEDEELRMALEMSLKEFEGNQEFC